MWLSQWAYLDACPLISGVVTLPRSLASFRWVHTLLTCVPPHCELVYSASAGLVIDGWINSPALSCPIFCDDATGKANFGFVSKYKAFCCVNPYSYGLGSIICILRGNPGAGLAIGIAIGIYVGAVLQNKKISEQDDE